MDLLDRYLQAVRKYLPWKGQDDVVAELRANLEAQLEDKEAELGRPLTTAEMEAWLKEVGSPIQVAGRYQPRQYLIGPGLFPIYWYVVRLACTCAFVVFLVITAVEVAMRATGISALWAVLRLPGVLMTVAAWVTLVFAVIEMIMTQWPGRFPALAGVSGDWQPGSLPPVEKASGTKPRSYAGAVAEVIFGFLFLGWLLLFPRHPYLLLGPGVFYMQVSPFHAGAPLVQFYWWVVAINVLQLVWRCVNLLRERWQQPQTGQRIAMKAVGLLPLVWLLWVRDQAYVTLTHPALDMGRYGGVLNTINHSIYRVVLVICVIVVLQLVWECGQMVVEAYRRRAAEMK
jgi:hypothetical protein